jgi:hypothetical protein
MALSGCPTIVGNSNKDSGQNSNVRLSSDLTTSDSMISIVGELTNTTPIGIAKDITEKNQGVFTTGSTDAVKYGGNEVMAFSALSYARAALSGSPGQDAANAMCALYRYDALHRVHAEFHVKAELLQVLFSAKFRFCVHLSGLYAKPELYQPVSAAKFRFCVHLGEPYANLEQREGDAARVPPSLTVLMNSA